MIKTSSVFIAANFGLKQVTGTEGFIALCLFIVKVNVLRICILSESQILQKFIDFFCKIYYKGVKYDGFSRLLMCGPINTPDIYFKFYHH